MSLARFYADTAVTGQSGAGVAQVDDMQPDPTAPPPTDPEPKPVDPIPIPPTEPQPEPIRDPLPDGETPGTRIVDRT
jgi:hypothetical protein